MIGTVTLFTSCVKLMLVPAYRSTDFEVHRNWLAVTHSLPVDRWYHDDTSEWTLDYPPLFAWFECLLSYVARFFDSGMLRVANLNYASRETILFQRLSVIFTDLVFTYGVHLCGDSLRKNWRTEVVLPLLMLTNAGLFMVDHIHFQYNGMLFGFFLISVAKMLQGKFLQGAFWFSILLNFKHIFLYVAPAYFVFLLRHYCFRNGYNTIPAIKRIVQLALIVVAIFTVSFAPFHDHLGQVLSRLFPFKRGLCHAYWAPNFWTVYNIADKASVHFGSKLGLNVTTSSAAMTGGLVQQFSHAVLPNISPFTTVMLTACAMIPALVKLWQIGHQPMNFIRCIVICSLTSFLFGWHVHEKAVLMSIIPLTVLAVTEAGDAKIFLILSTVGHYSLFPLLFPPSLLALKSLLLLLFTLYAFQSLSSLCPLIISKCTLPLLNCVESLYILGLIPLFLYETLIHKLLGLDSKLPFLPLMLVSFYCSIGVIYCWTWYYISFMRRSTRPNRQ